LLPAAHRAISNPLKLVTCRKKGTAMNRRDFLRNSAIGSAAIFAGCAGTRDLFSPDERRHRGEFSFVHLTDQHVRSKRRGDEGYRACIADVKKLKPSFALMGGDGPFDGCYNPKEEFTHQISLYKTINDQLGCPWYHCIGNHDVLGLSKNRKVPIDDPDMGRKYIMDQLAMPRDYYSFDHGDWHFVVLNCIHEIEADHGPSYDSRIGEEQLHWLAHDLGRANRPTMVVTHIAVISAADQVGGNTSAPAIHGGTVCLDTKDVRNVLERHGVKAVLQGHRHMAEDYLYNGVWYLSGDAVSACWWSGTWAGRPYGYTEFRCRPNGQFTWQRRSFEWQTTLEPEDELERNRQKEWDEFEAEQKRLLEEERSPALV
jgi:3',5'-cyclic AMP phosphodiesterase CpdA